MSRQQQAPGSRSLAPFIGKRSRDPSESDEGAESDGVWSDASRVKRAKSPEFFDFNHTAGGGQIPGYLQWTPPDALNLELGYEGPAIANMDGSQGLGFQVDGLVPWGSFHGYGVGEGNGLDFVNWGEVHAHEAFQSGLLEALPSIPIPQLTSNDYHWVENENLPTPGPNGFQMVHSELAICHEGGQAGLALDDFGSFPAAALVEINDEDLETGSKLIAPAVEVAVDLSQNSTDEAPIQFQAENTRLPHSLRTEVEYDTCFGVVCD